MIWTDQLPKFLVLMPIGAGLWKAFQWAFQKREARLEAAGLAETSRLAALTAADLARANALTAREQLFADTLQANNKMLLDKLIEVQGRVLSASGELKKTMTVVAADAKEAQVVANHVNVKLEKLTANGIDTNVRLAAEQQDRDNKTNTTLAQIEQTGTDTHDVAVEIKQAVIPKTDGI